MLHSLAVLRRRLQAASEIFGKRNSSAYRSVYLTFARDDDAASSHEMALGAGPIVVSDGDGRAELTIPAGSASLAGRLPVRFGMRFGGGLTDADLDIGHRSVPIMKLYYKVAIADDGSGNPSYPPSGLRPVSSEESVG